MSKSTDSQSIIPEQNNQWKSSQTGAKKPHILVTFMYFLDKIVNNQLRNFPTIILLENWKLTETFQFYLTYR